jgi:4-hydroxy-2-oxoheptanedioate aldolase
MRTNTTKAKLGAGRAVFGAIIGEHAPGLVELFGKLGYDFVMIDCEHGGMDLNQVEHMVRAAEVFGITPLARIPDHQPATVLRFLDRGVQGIIVPHVSTPVQAAAVARASRYHPDGTRSIAGGRPRDYNVGVSRADSTRWINEQTLVIAMIEDTAAVESLDAILAVPGLDVLHVASGDLGQSMGNPDPALVRAKMRELVARIHAAGRHAGIGGNAPTDHEGIAELMALGASFVTIQATGLLRLGSDLVRERVSAALDRAPAGRPG